MPQIKLPVHTALDSNIYAKHLHSRKREIDQRVKRRIAHKRIAKQYQLTSRTERRKCREYISYHYTRS